MSVHNCFVRELLCCTELLFKEGSYACTHQLFVFMSIPSSHAYSVHVADEHGKDLGHGVMFEFADMSTFCVDVVFPAFAHCTREQVTTIFQGEMPCMLALAFQKTTSCWM